MAQCPYVYNMSKDESRPCVGDGDDPDHRHAYLDAYPGVNVRNVGLFRDLWAIPAEQSERECSPNPPGESCPYVYRIEVPPREREILFSCAFLPGHGGRHMYSVNGRHHAGMVKGNWSIPEKTDSENEADMSEETIEYRVIAAGLAPSGRRINYESRAYSTIEEANKYFECLTRDTSSPIIEMRIESRVISGWKAL